MKKKAEIICSISDMNICAEADGGESAGNTRISISMGDFKFKEILGEDAARKVTPFLLLCKVKYRIKLFISPGRCETLMN